MRIDEGLRHRYPDAHSMAVDDPWQCFNGIFDRSNLTAWGCIEQAADGAHA